MTKRLTIEYKVHFTVAAGFTVVQGTHKTGLVLASSQIGNGYLVSPLATGQRAGVAKLATAVFRGV